MNTEADPSANRGARHKNHRRAKTGIAGLDEILCGGLIAQRLYLVDGNPGAGKTTLALQFLLEGIRAGEKCLYVTLSETKQELEAGAESHGWSLDGIEIIELIADEKELESDEQLTMLPPSEVELSETTRGIIDAVKRGVPRPVAPASTNNALPTATNPPQTLTLTRTPNECSTRPVASSATTSTAPSTPTSGVATSPATLSITTSPISQSGTTSAASRTWRPAS